MSDVFIDKATIIGNFPFVFRGNQEDALTQISDAINRPEIKYVIVQAPTGAGKSPLGMSAALSAMSYILTSNKILQDQYVRDFGSDISDLRGRSNYCCNTFQGFNCSGSPCRATPSARAECGKNRSCEYHFALDGAKNSHITSMNFAAAISFFNFTPYFTPRKLLIVDEAHLIPDNLTNFIEFTVSAQQIDQMMPFGSGDLTIIPAFDTAKEYLPWLRQIQVVMKTRQENFVAPSQVENITGGGVTYEKIEQFNRKLETIIHEITEFDGNLVADQLFADVKMTVVDKVSFKPIDVSRYAKLKLFAFAEKTLLMSATIINYSEFIKSLGIDPAEAVYIDIASTFPKENRPIIRNYVGTLNKDNLKALMPAIIREIKSTLRNHKDDKGIIHTHTYQIAKQLMTELRAEFGERLLFPENSFSQSKILAQHAASKLPTVLISPSMTEGVDLKDDLSRFQIIVKVPYPYMGDKVVIARMKLNPQWYGHKALLTLIQTYGRSTRSETDYSFTYILDGAFDGLVSRYRKTLPKWFTEAIL